MFGLLVIFYFLIFILALYIIYNLVLYICYVIFGYNNVKGFLGERLIRFIINKTKPESDYYVINDLNITTPSGHHAQIDHVVINHNGIFVIETKNYQGLIFGNDYELDWLQISKNGRRNYFYSPIKQNEIHIQRICEFIPDYLPIYSIVVFVKGNIKNIDSDIVVTPLDLKKIIEHEENTQLTHEEIIKTYNTLQLYNEKS